MPEKDRLKRGWIRRSCTRELSSPDRLRDRQKRFNALRSQTPTRKLRAKLSSLFDFKIDVWPFGSEDERD